MKKIIFLIYIKYNNYSNFKYVKRQFLCIKNEKSFVVKRLF